MTQSLTDVIAEAIRHELPLVPTTEVAVQAVLQAIDQAGYVVVPKEPTPEMIEAGSNAVFTCYGGYNKETQDHMRMMERHTNERKAKDAYRAMLSASKEGITE